MLNLPVSSPTGSTASSEAVLPAQVSIEVCHCRALQEVIHAGKRYEQAFVDLKEWQVAVIRLGTQEVFYWRGPPGFSPEVTLQSPT